MRGFARWVVKWRLLVVALVLVLTAAGGWAIFRWARVEADISKFLPKDDPVVKRFNEAGERFGSVAVAMVGLQSDRIFSKEGLLAIDELTRAFKDIAGVSWVISLTSADDVEKTEEGGERGVEVRKIFRREEFTGSEEQLRELKERVLSKERLVGTVVSADGHLAQFLIHITEGADRVEVAKEVERRAEELLPRLLPEAKLFFTGFPFWTKTLTGMILRDMLVLVPVVTLMIILVLWLSFRSLRGVLLPLLTVVVSAVWAMGLMAALDIPISTLSNVIPVLLIVLGTAYAIHLLHKYNETAGQVGDAVRALESALPDVMTPIAMAAATTMIGFLSFFTSSLLFIRQTGLIAACGIFFAMLVSLALLPAVLSWLPLPQQAEKRSRLFSGGSQAIARLVTRRKGTILAISAAVVLASAALMTRLERRFDIIAYFPPNSDVVQADEAIRQKMGGSVPLWVTLAGPAKHPYLLKSMLWIEKYLRSLEEVNHPASIAGLLAEIGDALSDRWGIPATEQGIGNLWLQVEGKDVLEQMVDKEHKNALVQAVCASSDSAVLHRVVEQVEDFISRLPRRARRVTDREDGDLLRRARLATAERAASLVELDLRARGRRLSPEQAARIAEMLKAATQKPLALAKEILQAEAERFLSSDESDVVLKDKDLISGIAAGFADAVAAGGGKEELEQYLRRVLPAEVLREDAEAPRYLALSLVSLAQSAQKNARAETLLREIFSALNSDPPSGPLRTELLGDLQELFDEVLFLPVPEGEPADVEFEPFQTGMHRISIRIDDQIVYSQLSSLGLAALVAMLLLMLQFRSVLAGLIGMAPMVFTLLVNFGVMAAFAVLLEPATVMIASLVVGVGIDYTIHFLSRFRLELLRNGSVEKSAEASLNTVGRAITINALTVACGQLVFLAGQLVPLRTFGALLALAMVVSCMAALLLLPALLMRKDVAFIKRRPD